LYLSQNTKFLFLDNEILAKGAQEINLDLSKVKTVKIFFPQKRPFIKNIYRVKKFDAFFSKRW